MIEDEQEKVLLADKKHFRKWLMALKEDVVGYVGSSKGCPLANWLNMDTNRGDYEVGREYYGSEGRTVLLPGWAWQFVTLLDIQDVGVVRGKEALEVLEDILSA